IYRLIGLAYNKIYWATSDDDYRTAQFILENAAERATKFNLASQFPDIYFDLGLINQNRGYKKDCEQSLNKYLEIAPNGPLASKAKTMLKKLN
ncbi:MAG: tetratricopeptide repeat protein, partial [Bacteroidota bacterium]|nr:tetratricopeptide repeat protein [Bacteroidota bacterium]